MKLNDRVLVSIDAHIADVVLSRANRLNAIDIPMFEALGAAADQIAEDRSVRAVVLRGDGGNFCSGIDLSVLANTEFDFTEALATAITPSPANLFQRVAYAWRELPMPVICAIEGVAFGGGLQIALGADIRYATPDAQLSIMESKWGIIPDMGISTTLRHLVAPDRVKELAWTARVFNSEEAQHLGLISAIADDPLQMARDLALKCAERSPNAIQGIKRLVNGAWQLSDEAALALEAELQGGIIGEPNQIEAVQAGLGKRAAIFKD